VTPESRAYVALALVPGIGRARLETLLAAFGSAEAVLQASLEELRAVPGMSLAAATAVRETSVDNAARIVRGTEERGGTVLLPSNRRFPQALKDIPDAPTLLFARGHLELLSRPAVAIVGSRSHTRYGAEACRHFAGGLARAGLAVVSGMARGLDAVAHTAALDAGGGTVGVLGNGLGVVYPAGNRALYDRVAEGGCLITEFPPGERPNAGSFPRRNRLVSGLARCTLVVEARERSGTLITVECALRQGKEAMAVPGPITSPLSLGTNRLIQQGAKPALGLRDVLEEYGMTVGDAPATTIPTDLTEREKRVLDVLGLGVEHVDEVARRLEGPASEALAILTGLEIRGLVTQEPGKIFRPAARLAAG
jgi:DNA processing protein